MTVLNFLYRKLFQQTSHESEEDVHTIRSFHEFNLWGKQLAGRRDPLRSFIL